MRRLLLALAVTLWLAACAMAVQTNLQSAYNLSVNSEVELTELQTAIVVSSTAEQYFMLVNLVVQNQATGTAPILIRLHETTTVIADSSATITVPPGSSTIQLPAFTSGSALGLGSHTFEVYVTKAVSASVIFQTTSYLGIFSSSVPGGVVVSINSSSAAMQSFATSQSCEGFTITTNTGTGVHTFCLPVNASGTNAVAFGEGATAAGSGAVSFGEGASAAGAGGVALGGSADASGLHSVIIGNAGVAFGPENVCVGFNCTVEDGAIAIGSQSQNPDANTAQIGGIKSPIGEMKIGPGDEQSSAVYPIEVTIRPNFEGGTNVPGIPLVLQGSPGTGDQVDGGVQFQVCPEGTPGAVANACAAAWVILPGSGNLVPVGDHDIGNIFFPVDEIGVDDLSVFQTTSEAHSPAQTVAAATTILANATKVQLNSVGSVVMTSAPTIANGTIGQRVTLENIDSTDVITLQDRSSLGGSNLRLRNGANFPLSAGGGNITLDFNQTIGDWIQVAGESVGTPTPTASATPTRTNTGTATPTP